MTALQTWVQRNRSRFTLTEASPVNNEILPLIQEVCGSGRRLSDTRVGGGRRIDPDIARANPMSAQTEFGYRIRGSVRDKHWGGKVGSKVVFNPSLITWVNFTEGDHPYRGTPKFDARMKLVTKALGDVSIADIEKSGAHDEITQLALNTGLSTDDVMRPVLAFALDAGLTRNTVAEPR